MPSLARQLLKPKIFIHKSDSLLLLLNLIHNWTNISHDFHSNWENIWLGVAFNHNLSKAFSILILFTLILNCRVHQIINKFGLFNLEFSSIIQIYKRKARNCQRKRLMKLVLYLDSGPVDTCTAKCYSSTEPL